MKVSRVGVIGAGTMGEAVIASLIRFGIASSNITFVEKREERALEIEKKYGLSRGSLEECDVIFLVVKPQDLEKTLGSLSGHIPSTCLLVSFLAGKKIDSIEAQLSNAARVIRVMPNTPMILAEGMSALSAGRRATKEDIEWVSDFLSSAGKVIVVPEEQQDTVTALSGSGPAYFFAMVEAMASAGEKLGLSKENSMIAAQQVLIGAAAMVKKSGKEPKTLRENVTSPNGTTHAALSVFENRDFPTTVYEAMAAARKRSIELSK